jgi:hypothetical protein
LTVIAAFVKIGTMISKIDDHHHEFQTVGFRFAIGVKIGIVRRKIQEDQ